MKITQTGITLLRVVSTFAMSEVMSVETADASSGVSISVRADRIV